MSKSDMLPHSMSVEKHCLAAMLQDPEIIADYLPFIKKGAFFNDVHEIVFESIKSIFSTHATVEQVLLTQQIVNLGINYKDDINVSDYIAGLYSLHGVNPDSVSKYFKELNKYHIARLVCKKCTDLSTDIRRNMNLSASEIIKKAEEGISDCVTSHVEDVGTPLDIYEFAEPYIENMGNEPDEDGVKIPFPIMEKLYGNLLIGDLAIVAAPAKAGKSTFLTYISRFAAEGEHGKVLYLDTELETERVVRRAVASESGVSEYYLRTGKWRNNAEMVEKVRGVWKRYNGFNGFDHLYAANKPIEEVVSIIRRWAAKKKSEFGKDVKLLVAYDYLKLTGEKPNESWKGYQIMGAKCDTIKHLCSEVGAAGLTAVQTNAFGDVAMSQEIKWFGSNIYRFIPKTPEEITEHGTEFGTHKLIAEQTRNLGEEGEGFMDFVQVTQQGGGVKYEKNFINFEFNNFTLTEKGTYEDIISRDAGHIDMKDDYPKNKGGRDYKIKNNDELL